MTDENKKIASLSESFIERVKKFKNTLKEVETMTIEESLSNFQKDRNPESELDLWEHMASAYEDFTQINPRLTLEEKKDVFRVLLQLSCGSQNLETEGNLNEKQIQYLKKVYTDNGGKAKPVVLSYGPKNES